MIGSESYKEEYCNELVGNWVKEPASLCEIAVTQPQSDYAAYTNGYRSKFTFFFRTIENFQQFVAPIDELLSERFIPTLFGSDTPLDEYRRLFTLNPSEGGLYINILSEEAEDQFNASTKITQPHVSSITNQENIMRYTNQDGKTSSELKTESRAILNEKRKQKRSR